MSSVFSLLKMLKLEEKKLKITMSEKINQKIKIVPAILESHFDNVERYIYEYKKISNKIQIDVCDGKYVENKTWLPNAFDDITFTDTDFEYDMMVSENNIEKYLNYLFFYDAKYIILHFSSFSNISNLENVIQKIRYKNKIIKIGIGLNSRQDINENIKNLLNKIDYIQIMGIKNIGLQRQDFDISVLRTIDMYKNYIENNLNKNIYIQIDGAMNTENIKKCAEVGANSFAVGSNIKNSEDKKKTMSILKNICL